jgi:hypothetical protein
MSHWFGYRDTDPDDDEHDEENSDEKNSDIIPTVTFILQSGREVDLELTTGTQTEVF